MLRTLFEYQRKIERPMGTSPDITPRQEAILVALRDYHVLAAPHVKKLLFGQNALSSAQTLLADLKAKGYVQRRFVSSETDDPREASSKAFYVYGLDALGYRFLRDQGRRVNPRFRPGDFLKLVNSTIRHSLDINAYRINLQLLTTTHTEIRLGTHRGEQELRRSPLRGSRPSGKKASIVADDWTDLRVRRADGVYQMSFWTEVDRKTHENGPFQDKCERLVAVIPQAYEQGFAAPLQALTISFIATEGAKHAKQLCTRIEQVLTRLDAMALAPLFAVTPTSGVDDDPEELFLSPRTLRPFQPSNSALIDLEGSGDG